MVSVLKRSGKKEEVDFNKIHQRIKEQMKGLSSMLDDVRVAQEVVQGLYDGVQTKELDRLAILSALGMAVEHPDYAVLAGRIAVSAAHKTNKRPFSEVARMLFEAGVLSDDTYNTAMQFKDEIDQAIDFQRDFRHDCISFMTLAEQKYLLRVNNEIVETPQHMWMRVAVGLWPYNIKEILSTYDMLSRGYFTHATPTLFNAGTKVNQMASCFLQYGSDSAEGIMSTMTEAAYLAKDSGGIGVCASEIRASGSLIRGGGRAAGLVPFAKLLDATLQLFDQRGKRKSNAALYVEPWHADIFEFLNLRNPQAKEDVTTKQIFTALMMPSLLFERAEKDLQWSLFCPKDVPGLIDSYGKDFEELYEKYEREGKARQVVSARMLMRTIVKMNIEKGTPYLANKDSINLKSNVKNVGVIKQSNLCIEIMEFTDSNNTAVCSVSSVCAPAFISGNDVDYKSLYNVTRQAIRNLNQIIDLNYYSNDKTERSNKQLRPTGLGIQGLADLFQQLDIPFTSDKAKEINNKFFETMYFAALEESVELAEKYGKYDGFDGSPASQGLLQYNLWGFDENCLSGMWDFAGLKERIKEHGLRNSLLLALPPTATTSQIQNNSESFEPYQAMVFKRKVMSGEYPILNKNLVAKLESLGLWNLAMARRLIEEDGSIQNIKSIPKSVRETYKTVFEVSRRGLIDMAADRGKFICQSQSFNIYFKDPDPKSVMQTYFYGYKKGLKTISYYTRIYNGTANKALGIGSSLPEKTVEPVAEVPQCLIDNPDCDSCGG